MRAVIGRDRELDEIRSFLDLEGGVAGVLLIQGEAGIGKTTLWQAGVEAARERSFRVLSASPSAAETGMSFAALADLLGGVADEVLAALPAPQRRALEVALLLREAEGSAPDQRAVAAAVLSVLRTLSLADRVLLAVDDVQWLDAASAATLAYAARRLGDERVGLLVAQRVADGDAMPLGLDRAAAEHVTSLRVGPLSLGATRRLLRERLGAALPRPVLRRVHETAGGNPFYALEIARVLPLERMVAGQPLPVPASLGELVRGRVAALPLDVQQVLAVAAALSEPRIAVVQAALDRDPRPALRQASEAGVVAVEGGRVRFLHPLLAAAAYGLPREADRREVHRRLVAAVAEPEERARHLALVADGPSEEVAAELEAAAVGAGARAAVAAAAELAEQAAGLTPADDEASLYRRRLLAAQYRFHAGDTGGAGRLLEELARSSPPGARRGRALADLARVTMFQGSRRRALALLREALADADEPRIRYTVEERLSSTLVVLREDLPAAADHARRSIEEAERLDDPVAQARALAAVGFVAGVGGDPGAERALERAIGLEQRVGLFTGVERPSFNLACVFMWKGELARARELFTDLYRGTADEGDDGSLAWTADNLANLEFLAGDWEAALRWAREGDELAAQTGQPGQQAYAKATIALVHAHRGDPDAARAAASEALELSGDEVAVGWMNGRWALGLLALSLGDAARAHDVLEPACSHAQREGVGEPGTMRFVFDDVEALASLGRIDEAEQWLAFIEGHARRLDRPFALAAAARCHGLLAAAAGNRGAALEKFGLALEQHERAPSRFDHARTLLALGEVRRRAKQKAGARESLGEARSLFDALGARLWSDRARAELGKIGGRVATPDELTPSERRIAELVAAGRTNKEVASVLYVTDRTVESHLTSIYRKLGVRSRAELARTFS